MVDTNSLSLSITHLLASYRSGQLTPEAVLAAIKERVRATIDYNVWISLLSDEQLGFYLQRLHGMDTSLPLYGIPFAIKDNIDLAGVATTAACADYSYVPAESAAAVEALLAAGAIPIGKTNLDQFATGLVGTRSPYGVTHNSFNRDLISGGSSSGSAVAVALGLVSFALGTDTAGSGRVPAAFNQLLGYKPSKGLISTRGVVPACRTLDCVTVFACSVEEITLIANELLAEADSDSQNGVNVSSNASELTALTVGIPREDDLKFFGGGNYRERFQKAVRTCQSLGWHCVEVNFAPFLQAAELLYAGPWVAERLLVIERLMASSPDSVLPVIRNIVSAGDSFSAKDTFKAMYKLQDLKCQADQEMQAVDCILTPTTGGIHSIDDVLAEPIKRNSELGYYTNFMNLLDYAAVALPADNPVSQIPCGITFFASHSKDRELLKIAQSYIQASAIAMGSPLLTMASHPEFSETGL